MLERAREQVIPKDALTLARELMDQHGLQDWDVQINTRLTVCGRCFRPEIKKLIELGAYYVWHNNKREVRETILHEIAHALTNTNHDKVWKAKCVEIGAKPERCCGKSVKTKPKKQLKRFYERNCNECCKKYVADRYVHHWLERNWCAECRQAYWNERRNNIHLKEKEAK